MPDLKETLLTRLGIAEAMGHRAKAAAGRLQQAAAKTHDSHQQELARLQQQIEAAGVGNDDEAEQRYCQLLVERMHLTQAHTLSGMDAARMPEIGGPALEKGRRPAPTGASLFDEEDHPRAPAGAANGGRFVSHSHAHAFRVWFHGSHVTTPDGEPLVVYHGTDARFQSFDPDLLGDNTGHPTAPLGFYFTESQATAEGYGRHTLPCYLDIKRPYPLQQAEWKRLFLREGVQIPREQIRRNIDHLRERLHAQGYDGIKMPQEPGVADSARDYGHTAWIAFQPRQIKHAENAGTFDPENPDMFKALEKARRSPPTGMASLFEEEEHPRLKVGETIEGYKPGEFIPAVAPSGAVTTSAAPPTVDTFDEALAWGTANFGTSDELTRSLGPDGAYAVQQYTSHAYMVVNAQLRGLPPRDAILTDVQGDKIAYRDADPQELTDRVTVPLLEALDRHVTKTPIAVFRGGTYDPEWGDIHTLKGRIIRDRAFLSTDLIRGAAQRHAAEESPETRTMMEIRTPAGTHALYVRETGLGEHENELILPPNTPLRVIEAADEGQYGKRLVLEVVPKADMAKARGRRNFVPPDMPTWPAERPRPRDSYHPLNGVEDKPKMEQMAAAMRRGEWTWNVPLVRCGDQLLTGSHRYHAAKVARVPLETVPIDDIFREAGLDFKTTWEANAQQYDGWLSNMDYAVKCLPAALREKYGIDLG